MDRKRFFWLLTRPVVCLAGEAIVLALAACAAPAATPAPEALLVSAASGMSLACEELGARYKQESGQEVTFNFAASGQLAQQIEQGAPVDLFISADVEYVEGLAATGRVLPDSVQIYGRGRLTVWTRADSQLTIGTLQDLRRPEVKRVAMVNPEHAPYGRAARQAMQTAGVWETVEPKLVLGENVRQTLQFAETGNVDVALIPLSLSVTSTGRWELVPDDLHDPIDQALGVVADSPRQAQACAFAAFITSPEGRAILRKYGFEPPGEVTRYLQ